MKGEKREKREEEEGGAPQLSSTSQEERQGQAKMAASSHASASASLAPPPFPASATISPSQSFEPSSSSGPLVDLPFSSHARIAQNLCARFLSLISWSYLHLSRHLCWETSLHSVLLCLRVPVRHQVSYFARDGNGQSSSSATYHSQRSRYESQSILSHHTSHPFPLLCVWLPSF